MTVAFADSDIAAYLDEHDAPRPGCSYNLRGMIARRCPERGYNIDGSVLKRTG